VCRTGARALGHGLHLPRSTVSTWKRRGLRSVVTLEPFQQDRQQLLCTIEKLKTLDFDNVIPGHGEPFAGKERIGYFQAYLTDFWKQAVALHDAHVSAADAARRIDMTAHKAHYPSITGPGVPLAGVTRVYEVIEHRAGD